MNTPLRTRLFSLFLALLLSLSLAMPVVAADDDPPETAIPASVSLNQTTMSLKVGETGTLTATLKDKDGKEITTIPEGVKVEWKSGDPEEASVSPASGSLTASVKALKTADTHDNIKEVSITLTVTLANGTSLPVQTCNVIVSLNVPDGVTVTPNTTEMAPGQKITLTASVTPDTLDQTVTWRSDNTAVATVNAETGEVTAVAAGVAKITATSKADPSKQGTCTIKVSGDQTDIDFGDYGPGEEW